MAKAPGDPSQWDAAGEVWFKINEWGPNFSGGSIQWPQLGAFSPCRPLVRPNIMKNPTANRPEGLTSYEFNLPSGLPSGNYLVRIEHIGVHNAANYGGAQFFVACGQVTVTGGGTGSPSPLVAFPGEYKADHPGIYFNNYFPAVSPPYTSKHKPHSSFLTS